MLGVTLAGFLFEEGKIEGLKGVALEVLIQWKGAKRVLDAEKCFVYGKAPEDGGGNIVYCPIAKAPDSPDGGFGCEDIAPPVFEEIEPIAPATPRELPDGIQDSWNL